MPLEPQYVCKAHRLPMLPFVDRDALGCGRGCVLPLTAIVASESEQDRWRREHGIVSKT